MEIAPDKSAILHNLKGPEAQRLLARRLRRDGKARLFRAHSKDRPSSSHYAGLTRTLAPSSLTRTRRPALLPCD
jgi:hypothetical protein